MVGYCQVLEGFRYDLMKAPSVSGSSGLCIAAKNEEKRLADLRSIGVDNVDCGSAAG